MEHAQKSSSGGVRTHLNQVTDPLHLAPLGVEVQQLYSEAFQDDQASLYERAQSSHRGSSLQVPCFGHYPQLGTIGEGRNIDRLANLS